MSISCHNAFWYAISIWLVSGTLLFLGITEHIDRWRGWRRATCYILDDATDLIAKNQSLSHCCLSKVCSSCCRRVLATKRRLLTDDCTPRYKCVAHGHQWKIDSAEISTSHCVRKPLSRYAKSPNRAISDCVPYDQYPEYLAGDFKCIVDGNCETFSETHRIWNGMLIAGLIISPIGCAFCCLTCDAEPSRRSRRRREYGGNSSESVEVKCDVSLSEIQRVRESDWCPICMDKWGDIPEESELVTSCGHYFCEPCAIKVLKMKPPATKGTCPLCRAEIKTKNLRYASSGIRWAPPPSK